MASSKSKSKSKSKSASKAAASKARGRASASAGCALLWNLDLDTPKGAAVRDLLTEFGVRVCTLRQEDLNQLCGSLAGVMGTRPVAPYEGVVPREEFLMLCGLSSAVFQGFLSRSAQEGISVAHKAALTPVNRFWPVIKVMEQVAQEHEAMTGSAKAGAPDAAPGAAPDAAFDASKVEEGR